MKVFIAITNFYRDVITVSVHKTSAAAREALKHHTASRPVYLERIRTKEQKAAPEHIVYQEVRTADLK
jgi:hypothetical protein